MRTLWLTCDFANCLSTETDTITPQLFLTLMAHPAISQIKRFTQSNELAADDVAQWEPGIFTVQAYRSSLLEVLSQIASHLASHLVTDDTSPDQITITIYTQLGRRHHPTTTSLTTDAIKVAAETIEAMVHEHEQSQANVNQH